MVRFLTFGAAAVIMIVAVARFFSPVQYEAYALLRVSSTSPTVLSQVREETRGEFEIFKRTQVQLLLSGLVLRGAVREPEIKQLSVIKQHDDDPVAWLRDELLLDYPDDAEILRVSLKGENPADIVKIVDKVVDNYLTEVVQTERMRSLQQEDKLERKYKQITAEFTREKDALLGMEQLARVDTTAAGQVERKLTEENLQEAIATRNFLNRQILENEIKINLLRAKTETSSQTRTANADAAAEDETPAGEITLQVLEEQRAFLEDKLIEARDHIIEQTKSFEKLGRDTGSVTAKRESVAALRQIMMELKAMLDRANVDRLAQARITRVDDAVLVSNRGNMPRRYAGLSVAAIVSLGLVVIGMAAGRRTKRTID